MSIIESILEVFGLIAAWFGEAFTALTPIFWVPETGLTLMGTLTIAGLSFAVCFLFLGIIQKFMRFGA